MKDLLTSALLAAMLAMSSSSYAQSSISGQIRDHQSEVSFASVLLLDAADSSLVKGAVSDVTGSFRIPTNATGEHLIKVSSIGYEDLFQSISLDGSDIDLGTLTVSESAEQLDDVIVTAKKPLYEQKIDRTVVNVQSSVTASAGSALDVLEKSPGVTVNRSTNAISLAGKNGVRVMINGKISRMPASAVMQMLNGMNAENVESIELITTPPAKFEAEGNAGIINIVLKQTEDDGTNGSYSVFAGYGKGEKAGGSLNFNHRKSKINLFGNFSYRYDHTEQFNGNDRIVLDSLGTPTTTITQSFRDAITETYNGQLGFDYQLGSKSIIGSNLTFFHSAWEMDADNIVTVDVNQTPSSFLDMFNHEVNDNTYVVGNLNFNHKFNDKNSLSVELDYINFYANNPTEYDQNFDDLDGTNGELPQDQIESGKETPLYTWIPRIDYSWNVNDKLTFEAGGKAVMNTLENEVRVDYINDGVVTPDPDLTRKVFMTEDIWAGYTSLSFQLTPTIDIKAGLRYEHTTTDLDTRTEQNVVYRDYGRWFPSVFLNKKINDNNSYVMSYSRRVTRPTFRNIAPFVIFLDPNTFWTGNESLFPAITDAYRAEYRFKSYLLSVQYSREKDAIYGFQPRLADDGETQLTTSENMDFEDSYSVSVTLPFDITDWWEMQYNVTAMYNVLESNQLGTPVRLTNSIVRGNGSTTFKLPKDFNFEISGVYWSPSYFGIQKFEAFSMLNFGLEKKLSNDNGSLRLSFTDVFSGRDFRGKTVVPEENLNVRSRFTLEGAIWQVSYTKNFGNNKLKKLRNKQSSSQDEQRRIQ